MATPPSRYWLPPLCLPPIPALGFLTPPPPPSRRGCRRSESGRWGRLQDGGVAPPPPAAGSAMARPGAPRHKVPRVGGAWAAPGLSGAGQLGCDVRCDVSSGVTSDVSPRQPRAHLGCDVRCDFCREGGARPKG